MYPFRLAPKVPCTRRRRAERKDRFLGMAANGPRPLSLAARGDRKAGRRGMSLFDNRRAADCTAAGGATARLFSAGQEKWQIVQM